MGNWWGEHVCDHTNQHLLYHPMQGEAAFENPKLFCVGVFQKETRLKRIEILDHEKRDICDRVHYWEEIKGRKKWIVIIFYV